MRVDAMDDYSAALRELAERSVWNEAHLDTPRQLFSDSATVSVDLGVFEPTRPVLRSEVVVYRLNVM